MLANVTEIVRRAGALLDDPSNSTFTQAYLMPFVDQCFETLSVEMERAGMQYVEATALVPVAIGVSDLSPLLANGQALASMKLPRRIDWKLQSQPDPSYVPSEQVVELDDVFPDSVGALEWRYAGGALSITPSSAAMMLRIRYDQLSTNMVDGATGVVRGTAHILALRVAVMADGRRKGMENRMKINQMEATSAWNAFKDVLGKSQQGIRREPPAMHSRLASGFPNVSAPTS